MRTLTYFACLLIVLSAFSCSKKEEVNPDSFPEGMSLKINDTEYKAAPDKTSATKRTSSSGGRINLNISASAEPTDNSFGFAPILLIISGYDGPQKYDIGIFTGKSISAFIGGFGVFTQGPESGSITITKEENGRVMGTFSFCLYCGNSALTPFRVTEGTFNVPLNRDGASRFCSRLSRTGTSTWKAPS